VLDFQRVVVNKSVDSERRLYPTWTAHRGRPCTQCAMERKLRDKRRVLKCQPRAGRQQRRREGKGEGVDKGSTTGSRQYTEDHPVSRRTFNM
jgi:hypothetical protein